MYYIEDLQSTNGTKVNSIMIKGVIKLNNLDKIEIGKQTYIFIQEASNQPTKKRKEHSRFYKIQNNTKVKFFILSSNFPITIFSVILLLRIALEFLSTYLHLPDFIIDQGYISYNLLYYTPLILFCIGLFLLASFVNKHTMKENISSTKHFTICLLINFSLLSTFVIYWSILVFLIQMHPYNKLIHSEKAYTSEYRCLHDIGNKKIQARYCYEAGMFFKTLKRYKKSLKYLASSCQQQAPPLWSCEAYAKALVTYPNINCNAKLALTAIQIELDAHFKRNDDKVIPNHTIDTSSLVLAANGRFQEAIEKINLISTAPYSNKKQKIRKEYKQHANLLKLNKTYRQFNNIPCKNR